MAADLNSTHHIGRLTADPKQDTTQGGTIKVSFSIAVNGYKNGDVSYFDVVVFGKLAEICAVYLKKGKQVAITGKLHQQRWNDKETGKPRQRIEIIASDIQMIGAKDNGAAPQQQDGEDNGVPF